MSTHRTTQRPEDHTGARPAVLPPEPAEPSRDSVPRRTVLRGATLGGLSLPLLAACGGGNDASAGSASGDSTSPSSASSASSHSSSPGTRAGGSGTTVATSDVPVGGGAILPDAKVVVTQPKKGVFKAFTAVCTHQGCVVAEVTGAQIVCKCHGSHFSITDGAPVAGPAQAPLAAKKVSVKGTRITVT